MKLQKHWYLGFLGIVGIYYIPMILELAKDGGNLLGWGNCLWFLWFLYFIPENAEKNADH